MTSIHALKWGVGCGCERKLSNGQLQRTEVVECSSLRFGGPARSLGFWPMPLLTTGASLLECPRGSDAGMSSADQPHRQFVAKPRRARHLSSSFDDAHIRAELIRILHRTQKIAESDQDVFVEGSPFHDVASMVMIRLTSLSEKTEFGPWAQVLTPGELAAIRSIGNVALHPECAVLDDDLLWDAVTVRVPEIIDRLLRP